MIVNCGAYNDIDFLGGLPYQTANTIDLTGITGALPQEYYQTCRYGTATFGYVIPGLIAGATYDFRLHFADPYFAAPGNRVGKFSVNGTVVAAAYDIVAAAGAINKASVLSFSAEANTDGALFLVIDPIISNPLVCAIELNAATPIPGTPPSTTEQKTAWVNFAAQCYAEFLHQGLPTDRAGAQAVKAADLLLSGYRSRWTT